VSALAVMLASLSLSAAPSSAAPATAATVAVSGTVSFGSAGNHPAGESAVVTWLRYETDRWAEGPSEGVRTDVDGHYAFALEPGSYKFRYTSASGAYQSVYWGGASTPSSLQYSLTEVGAAVVKIADAPVATLDLTLPPLGSISGRVFLGDPETPAGVGDARVTASRCFDGSCTALPAVMTDATGGYRFAGLLHGEYAVHFEYVAGTDYRSYDEPVRVAVEAPQLDVTGVNHILPATPTVSGTVVLGADRVPAGSDVVVTARRYAEAPGEWTDTSIRTAPDGSFSFPGLVPGLYDVRFDYQGTGGFADQWWPGKAAPTASTRIRYADIPLDYDISLPMGTSVTGAVRTVAGAPIAGASVTATLYSGENQSSIVVGETLTAADGTYSLTGLPPAAYGYSFYARAEGYIDQPMYWAYDSLGEGEVRTGVDAEMTLFASISGSISCERCDEPAVGDQLFVQFERNVGTRSEPAWILSGGAPATPTEAADGSASYEFTKHDGLQPGMYRASVQGGWGWRTRANHSPVVTVEDGAEVTLDLEVEFLEFDRDFSGDEHPDVIATTGAGALLMYSGDGASGWSGVDAIGSGWAVMDHVFAAGDFSGDGHEDVMARDGAGRLHLYRGDGRGGWLGWGVVGTGWGHMTAIFSPGDFSGDGNADVLARDGAGDLWLYPGDGKGGWGEVWKVGSGWNIFDQVFAVGDFGGYGEANVMGRTANGDLWVYQASGWGSWIGQYRAGTGWGIMDAIFGAGDFDGDGWDDVMGRDTSGLLWLYPGEGGLFKLPSVIGTGWSPLGFVS
jgi:hypothetical protein